MILGGGMFAFPVEIVQAKSSYNYQLVSQSPYPNTAKPGDVINVWIEVQNTGIATWYNSGSQPVRLGSGSSYGGKWQGRDYDSEFWLEQLRCGNTRCVGAPEGWLSKNRPTAISDQVVASGETTRFQFNIKAPEDPGIYKAYFTPVVDGVEWMKDIGIYWEIEVSRRQPYSFDYLNIDNPVNKEVNKNTVANLSYEQQLLVDSLKNQIGYSSLSSSTDLDLKFKLNKETLDENPSDTEDVSSMLSDYGISFDFSKRIYDTIHLNLQVDETSIESPLFPKVHANTKFSVSTISTNNMITPVLDSDFESIADGNNGMFSKINDLTLFGDYFTYSKPDTWYGEVLDDDAYIGQQFGYNLGGYGNVYGYGPFNNDLKNLLDSYPKAIARDLSRAGINIVKSGIGVINGISCDILYVKIGSEELKSYTDIINEYSLARKKDIDDFKKSVDEYFEGGSVTFWVNPTTKMLKKVILSLDLNPSEYFDSFSLNYTFDVHSINDSSLTVSRPASFENLNQIDVTERLQEKINSTTTLSAKISIFKRSLSSKVSSYLQKATDYIKNL